MIHQQDLHRACFSCMPLVPRFDVITGILSFSFMPGSNWKGAHMVPFPHHHSPPAQNEATAVHGWGHEHTETSPSKAGPGWALLLRRGLFSEQSESQQSSQQSSQLLPEASSRSQLLPRMYSGCWISNAAWAQTRHWCLFYIFLSSACWSHTWHSGSQLDISYWLQLDLNCAPAEWYCSDSLWKSSDRIAFSWVAETSRMTWKSKLGVCWELKLFVCLWGLTHSLSDVLQQPGCNTPHIFKQSRKIYLLNNRCHPRISLSEGKYICTGRF